MERFRNAVLLAALAVATLALPLAATAAGDDEAARKVVVKEYVLDQCEGEECDQESEAHGVIAVGDDGEVHALRGRGAHGHGPHGLLHHGGKGGSLGVATSELTPELRRHFGVPEEAGVLVARVVDDSAAARAGILVGDILTAVDGEPVRSPGDLMHEIGRHEPGAAVQLELWRDGILQTVGATLGERRQRHRRVMLHRCSEGEECPEIATLQGFDCGDEGDCEVRIECRDGACDCTVDGEALDCEELPGFVVPDD